MPAAFAGPEARAKQHVLGPALAIDVNRVIRTDHGVGFMRPRIAWKAAPEWYGQSVKPMLIGLGSIGHSLSHNLAYSQVLARALIKGSDMGRVRACRLDGVGHVSFQNRARADLQQDLNVSPRHGFDRLTEQDGLAGILPPVFGIHPSRVDQLACRCRYVRDFRGLRFDPFQILAQALFNPVNRFAVIGIVDI